MSSGLSDRIGRAGESARNRLFQRKENRRDRFFSLLGNTGQNLFSALQNKRQREFTADENALQRKHQTGEREAGEEFATGERIGGEKFITDENALQREYQTAENALERKAAIRQILKRAQSEFDLMLKKNGALRGVNDTEENIRAALDKSYSQRMAIEQAGRSQLNISTDPSDIELINKALHEVYLFRGLEFAGLEGEDADQFIDSMVKNVEVVFGKRPFTEAERNQVRLDILELLGFSEDPTPPPVPKPVSTKSAGGGGATLEELAEPVLDATRKGLGSEQLIKRRTAQVLATILTFLSAGNLLKIVGRQEKEDEAVRSGQEPTEFSEAESEILDSANLLPFLPGALRARLEEAIEQIANGTAEDRELGLVLSAVDRFRSNIPINSLTGLPFGAGDPNAGILR